MIENLYKPLSIEEALTLYKSYENSCWFAGGTSINYGKNTSRSVIAISLEMLGLNGIKSDGSSIIIGSMVSLQTLSAEKAVPPVLKEAARNLYSRNIRNMATIGGNIGAKAPDSCLIPLLVALGTELETASKGRIPLESYIDNERDDLILSVIIPGSQSAAIRKVSRTSSSSMLVNAAVALGSNNSVRVVINGMGDCYTRLDKAESLLLEGSISGQDNWESALAPLIDPEEDFRCSREYKIYIASVLLAECISECQESIK